jgi:hypothetical protein
MSGNVKVASVRSAQAHTRPLRYLGVSYLDLRKNRLARQSTCIEEFHREGVNLPIHTQPRMGLQRASKAQYIPG